MLMSSNEWRRPCLTSHCTTPTICGKVFESWLSSCGRGRSTSSPLPSHSEKAFELIVVGDFASRSAREGGRSEDGWRAGEGSRDWECSDAGSGDDDVRSSGGRGHFCAISKFCQSAPLMLPRLILHSSVYNDLPLRPH